MEKVCVSCTEFVRACACFLSAFVLCTTIFSTVVFANQNSGVASSLILPRAINITMVETSLPTDITKTSARVNGRILLDNTYEKVEYFFEYGTTIDYTHKTTIELRPGQTTVESNVSFDLADLTCDTGYNFRLVTRTTAVDGEQHDIFGGNGIFKTLPCDELIIVSVAPISTSQTAVVISASFFNRGIETNSYLTFGETTEMLMSTEPYNSAGGTITQEIGGLICGTTYYAQFIVGYGQAFDVSSEVITFQTSVCPMAPELSAITPTVLSETSVLFQAQVSANGLPAELVFDFGPTDALGQSEKISGISLNADNRIYERTVNNLSCGTRYYYSITLSNALGVAESGRLNFSTYDCILREPVIETTAGVFSGARHSIAIGLSGEIVTWGDNQFSQLGELSRVVNVVDGVRDKSTPGSPLLAGFMSATGGGGHTLLLHQEGWIAGFGNNFEGQVGVSNIPGAINVPAKVINESGVPLTSVADIAAGDRHSVAVLNRGRVYTWGDNKFGQLSFSGVETVFYPTLIDDFGEVIEVAAGKNFTLARLVDNTVFAWGENTFAQLGEAASDFESEPVKVRNAENIAAIAAGDNHGLALTHEGEVLAWGSNALGQLGMGRVQQTDEATFVTTDEFRRLSGVKKIVAGANHNLVLMTDGAVFGWGDNSLGQLGVNGTNNIIFPEILINGFGEPWQDIVDISAGADFSVLLTSNGKIHTFGNNLFGQLDGRNVKQIKRAQLSNQSDALINIFNSRIVTNTDNIRIKENEESVVRVWLSQQPVSDVEISASLIAEGGGSTGIDILSDSTWVVFQSEWSNVKQIRLKASGDVPQGSRLLINAQDMSAVEIEIQVVRDSDVIKKQVIGALTTKLFLFSIFYLLYFRMIRKR